MERDLLLTKIGTSSLMTAITWGIIILIGCSGVSKETATVEYQERYEYDPEGGLICKIAPDGSKTEYKYNDQGLLTKISYPKGSVSYGYDASGNRVWMEDAHGRAEYRYDAFERLVEVTFRYGLEKRIKYEYDPWSRISSILILGKDGVEYQVEYEYNILGNLVSIDDGMGRIEYSYCPDRGEVVRILPNGIKTIFSFSPLGELTALNHQDQKNRLIASYRYEYEPSGKVSRVIEETPDDLKVTKYVWNKRGYLKSLHLPDGQIINYDYDSMGNRISQKGPHETIQYKYDNFGRLIKAENKRYKWDKNGNLLSLSQKGHKTSFTYSERNLLSSVGLPKAKIHYGWDGDGNMIFRKKEKDINYYLQNPLAPPGFTLAEYDDMGKIRSTYLYGDTLLGQRDRKGQMKYFLEDGFNSIRHTTDTYGKAIVKRDYTPFGEPMLTKGNIAMNFRMAGERFLPEIKSYSIGGRLYKPKIGRYLTPAPFPGHMERFDSFNRYAHACNAQGIFEEPRCNQTRKTASYPNPEIIRDGAVIVGGVNTTAEDIRRSLPSDQWAGVGTISTSVPFPAFFRFPMDVSHAIGNYLTGYIGPTGSRVMSELRSNYADRKTLIGHSNGALTLWNVREDLAEAVRNGNLKFEEIYLAGVSPTIARDMHEYFKDKGVKVSVFALRLDDPRVKSDVVAQLTIPGRHILPVKGAGIIGAHLAGVRKSWNLLGWALSTVLPGEFLGTGPHELKGHLEDIEKGKYITFPPGGGGGSGGLGGGLFGKDASFCDPFKSFENQLGGIKLSGSVEFLGSLRNIIGVVYDPEKQCLVLVGNEDVTLPSMKVEDLAVALACAFDPRYGDPQFSLDPADPRNPRGEWLKAVYMPEEVIRGTPFGKAMFDADWLLKQYTFGVTIEENGRIRRRSYSASGFKSVPDLTFECKDRKQGQETWARYWIVEDDHKIPAYRYGYSLKIGEPRMIVKAKKQVPDPTSPTGLRDVESDDPIASAFAAQFSDRYDEISTESPEFGRVKELTKVVALANWLKKENIPVDMDWVTEYVNRRIDTVDRITSLSHQWERRTEIPFTSGNRSGIQTIIRRLYLFGGVDEKARFDAKRDNGSARTLQNVVVSALRKKETGPVFEVTCEGKPLRAVVLPITKSGQEMWRSRPTTDKDGNIYQFNDDGLITKSTDHFGNVWEYGYDANQKLKTIRLKGKDGWDGIGEKNGQGSLWTVTNPKGNVFKYRYGDSGRLNKVELDGKKLATYNYDPDRRILNIHHQGYVEKVSYDRNGYVREYNVKRVSRDPESAPEAEKITFAYDDLGNITRIEGPSVGHTDILYSEDKLPTIVSTPREETYYSYDTKQQIKEVFFSSGLSAIYTYDGEKLTKIEIKRGDKQAVYRFHEGHLVKIHNLLGGSTEYNYNERELLSSVIDPERNTGKYVYDEKSRLREIHFPDGRWIEYGYGERKGHTKKPHPTPGQLITVTHHSSSSPLKRATREKSRSIEYYENVLNRRLEDDVRASKYLKNGLIIDLFAEPKGMTHANIVDSSGRVKEINPDIAKELRWLLNRTARTRGKLGRKLLDRWERFYNTHLKPVSKPAYWKLPDGKLVKQKAILIIKSNEVSYKYANLEKVPVLAENFIIFIASKPREEKGVVETSADELVTKIKNIPKLSKENVVFAIRPPRMKKEMQKEWKKAITELELVVGKGNVLFNPSKEDFDRMLHNRGKEIIVIELTHTDKGITLKGNERFNARDVFLGGDLSHIKYLIAGLGTCSLPRLENGKLAAAFRKKGVGIMNGSFGSVSTEIALKRLKKLIGLFESLDEYDFPAYYLPDIIDQLIDVPRKEKGTTNLGKLIYHKRSFLG